MEIVDLAGEHRDLYFCCLEDWSDEMTKESGPRKAAWYETMKDRGLRVRLARDDSGEIGGMIQYLPIELSPAEGEGLYFILCIWVHGHKEGRGDFQGRGMGKALLAAAEADARGLGAKGMAAWGLWLPFWMRVSWFRRRGYRKADRNGIAVLVWKPFSADAAPPRWIKETGRRPELAPGKVTVTSFVNGWCPAQNLVHERAKRAAAESGDRVVFREIETLDRGVMRSWGMSDALFIDDRQVGTGPPLAYEKLRRLIAKRLRKLR